jgi:luciferase family oxidoreductase group 1
MRRVRPTERETDAAAAPPAPAVPPPRLSVLDQSPVSEGSSGAQALRNTVDLAQLADELGYHRYWLAEHHEPPTLAGASPEVLIGPVAMATRRMRVGSGGVILPHYSPRKVAETFSVLSGLFGDRIDLGLGRAAGTDDPATIHALQRDRRTPSPDDFPEQLAELLAYLEERPPPDRRFAGLLPVPGLPERPEPWLLGSSMQSAVWAAQLGLPYAFGDFINSAGAEMAQLYRRQFVDSLRLPAPRLVVCISAICADTDEEAEELAASRRMTAAVKRRGELIPVPPVEKARRYLEANPPPPERSARRIVIGSPATVRAGLETVARDYGADEVMVVTITHAHEARRRSYELIAEAFGLERVQRAGGPQASQLPRQEQAWQGGRERGVRPHASDR